MTRLDTCAVKTVVIVYDKYQCIVLKEYVTEDQVLAQN